MDQKTIYAVVDLETTGTNVKTGDRIIQFGCVLVQNGKIIQTISQDVNPLREVPEKIRHLTHISADQLEFAPIFEDLAGTFSELLKKTVFVAHNINFDLPFLNAELVRVGAQPLDLAGIDTVELAQIVLPEAPSYRLQDLTRYLSIEHDNPHRADSDALVTAKLFIQLTKRLQELPLVTLHQLSQLGRGLLRQTGDFFDYLYQTMREHSRPLPPQLVICEGLALKKVRSRQFKLYPGTNYATKYPQTEMDKKRLLKQHLKWRKAQANMMDLIYENYRAGKKPQPLMIEAATGLGKTLGYLLPYAYLSDPQHKLVVATSTTLLQDQILTQAVPLLEKLTGKQVNAEIIKSARHYIDLHRFAVSLALPHKNRLTRLLQMKLLIWLTQTDTGDLDELNLTSYNATFFAGIRHGGTANMTSKAPFYDVDFLRRLEKRQLQAEILVTNHAYLAQHAHSVSIWGQRPYLVLDEAQNLSLNVQATSHQGWSLSRWQLWCQKSLQYLLSNQAHSVGALFENQTAAQQLLQEMRQLLQALNDRLIVLQAYLTDQFNGESNVGRGRDGSVRYLQPTEVNQLLSAQRDNLKQIGRQLALCATDFLALRQTLEAELMRYQASDLNLWQAFENELNLLLDDGEAYRDFERLFMQKTPQTNQALSIQKKVDSQTKFVTQFSLEWRTLETGPQIQAILSHFQPATLTGATLTTNGEFDFLKRQFGFPEETTVTVKKLRSPFHFKQQARFFIAADGPVQKNLSTAHYYQAVAAQIETLTAKNEHQTLVLFNSHQVLEQVFYILNRTDMALDRELLAQGVTGGSEKIAKRFMLGKTTILLATSNFAAGIDFPETTLEQVILVQLPFDSPGELETKVRYAQLTANGENPFQVDALPKATIRLRQAFGRLIRTPNDRGVFICLDSRLNSTRYGHQMRHSLPASLPQKTAPIHEIRELIDLFWLNSD